ncbi:hypothetical protein [Deinococcus maricopensis]|uniref:DNA damage repair protein n=1 Tax=Deinococcus maricopensis (strain DSM 21211 / LMG 22137 / NRRL B-23946 / LB-34) TaxID=709986 RepID=E8U4A8_DEIML|nr:hypothetical protein [Deinococcus maricopensis]ADV65945.1 DNA damage repair protein [Deinococcus maricopensis DSM 21211]
MTKTSKKPADTTPNAILKAFDTLTATADVEHQLAPLANTADATTLDTELTRALNLAHDRWGLGLLHHRHEARLRRDTDTLDVVLLADGREIARLSDGPAAISATYESMRALNADNLSEWGVLPEGHRVTLKGGTGQLRVLIEDARDFETHWNAERGGAYSRTWRDGDTLAIEVHRPASPVTALADAAWDVITSIKDRPLQRQLMERSNSVGMLGALLAARHSGAGRALEALPEAHFTIRSTVLRATGRDARDFDHWKTMLREGVEQLDVLQKTTTRQLAEILSHGLK